MDADQLATIVAPYFREDFAQDLNSKRATELGAAQTPTSPGILFTPSGQVAWHQVPSWYAVSGADRVIDPALQRFMAERAGATTVTFDDTSHAGGFTHYAGPVRQAGGTGGVVPEERAARWPAADPGRPACGRDP